LGVEKGKSQPFDIFVRMFYLYCILKIRTKTKTMKKAFQILMAIFFAATCFFSCKDADDPVIIVDDDEYVGWSVGGDTIGGIIVFTANGGKTWVSQTENYNFQSGLSDVCIIDPLTLIVVGGRTNDGSVNILMSETAGETWHPVLGTDLINANYGCIYNLDGQHFFIVGDSGSVYRSADWANTWEKISVPEKYKGCNFLRVAAKSPNDIWVVGDYFAPDTTPIMLHTTDGGLNWIRPDPIKELNIEAAYCASGHYLGIKLFGNSVWAIGGFGQFVVRSADNGATWANITSEHTGGNSDANDIFVLSENEAYVVYDYGTVLSTSDAGMDWTEYYTPSNDWLTGMAIIENVNLWVCGSPGGSKEYSQILFSDDAGTTWTDQSPDFIKNNASISLYKIRMVEVEIIE
jgi:photosystem II stability/assembly factor-like uncharacterized protein